MIDAINIQIIIIYLIMNENINLIVWNNSEFIYNGNMYLEMHCPQEMVYRINFIITIILANIFIKINFLNFFNFNISEFFMLKIM